MTSPYSTYFRMTMQGKCSPSDILECSPKAMNAFSIIFIYLLPCHNYIQLQYFEASSNFLKQAQNGSNVRGISDLAKSGQVATRHLSKLQPLQQPAPHWSVGPAVAVGPVGPVGFEPWEITVQQGEVYKYGKLNDPSYINYIIHYHSPLSTQMKVKRHVNFHVISIHMWYL